MDRVTIISIAAPCGVVFLVCCCIAAGFGFVKNRRKPLKVLVPITYESAVPLGTSLGNQVQRPMTKKEKRDARLKKLSRRAENAAYRKQRDTVLKQLQDADRDATMTSDLEAESLQDSEASEDDEVPFESYRQSMANLGGLLKRVSMFFSLRSSVQATEVLPENDATDEEALRATVEAFAESMQESTPPAASPIRRSQSPQRLMKLEKRRQSLLARRPRNSAFLGHDLSSSQEILEDDADDLIVNVMTLDQVQQAHRDRIIAQRKDRRYSQKLDLLRQGIEDVVVLNSGPPSSALPPNMAVVETLETLDLDFMMYKRIMYHMEFREPYKPTGWYIATVVGGSKQEGCNFNIKFDRAETGTLFVDGVHAVGLSFEGENAYGRRWVIVQRRVHADKNLSRESTLSPGDRGGIPSIPENGIVHSGYLREEGGEGDVEEETRRRIMRGAPNTKPATNTNRLGSPMTKRAQSPSLGLGWNSGVISPSTLSARIKSPLVSRGGTPIEQRARSPA